ncbi:MAG TPA: DUF6431 domain-containing protein, partial [Alphaproteobacteria bacterium]|nr:DUF6431 domain-containing protein [Alphaproteobacteria bacterium]
PMTDHRPPPPEPEGCLTYSRASRYKGGTLIAEDVHDLETHRRRIADPDGYRLAECPRCGGRVLHVHDYPRRKPRGEPGLPREIPVVRYICTEPDCEATWRILPALLARHLWRVWSTIEQTVSTPSPPKPCAMPVPEQTARRWRARLASAARQIVVLLATSGGVLLEAIAKRVGLESARVELVDVHAQMAGAPPGRRLADLAALVHRLERGIRLM